MSIVKIAIYMWSAFWIYWILSAMFTRLKVKKEYSGQVSIQRSFHLIFTVMAFAVTFFRINFIYLDNIILPRNFIIQWTGAAILFLSLSFAIWARITLGRNWSGAIQKVEGQRLVRNGPYKYVRNPIYTGIVCGFFCTFVTFGTFASLLGFCIILTAYIIKINKEQNFLIQEFGEEYKKYIRESWALIPYIF